jgi:hypothetical protein
MKLILITLALATCSAVHAQQAPQPLTDEQWQQQAVQQQRRMQYMDDLQYQHAQYQVQQAIDYQNCMFNKRYGYSNKDCD